MLMMVMGMIMIRKMMMRMKMHEEGDDNNLTILQRENQYTILLPFLLGGKAFSTLFFLK